MIITIIGLFHLIHSPLLVIFPFVFNNFTSDILYINYFFFIMFLYTFVNGECPISYVCKLMIDNKYIAGSNITYYPEMERLLSQRNIVYYFGTTTLSYMVTLLIVIFRTNTLHYAAFTLFILLNYYYFIHNQGNLYIVQEITKYTLMLTICLYIYQLC